MTEKTVRPRGGEKRKKIRVLFVCLGNICRSPAAEGVLRAKAREQGLDDRLEVDSAGTYGGHAGQLPDPRMREAALRRGVKVSGATVHFVNEIPDGGEIIEQKAVRVLPNDTPERLQQRVMRRAEWIILPRAVEQVAAKLLKQKEEGKNQKFRKNLL